MKAATVALEHITTEPLLLLDETSRMGQITKGIFTQRGLPVHPLIEIESVEGLKEMVRQGIGVTLTLPALIRPSQIGNDLVLLPITGLTEEFIFALVYRRVGSISRAAREFINTILQH
jgi:DNA-binding transcriptional LysR family regulator